MGKWFNENYSFRVPIALDFSAVGHLKEGERDTNTIGGLKNIKLCA